MKNKLIITALSLIIFVTCFFFVSCEEEIKYPKFRYAVGNCVPDSNKIKMANWITQTVSATNLHMTGGDYEDPEDVILQCERTAEKLFSVKSEGLEYQNCANCFWEFTPKQDLTDAELKKLQRLKNHTQ